MLMYLCPALMDWLLFFVLFAVLYSAGIRGFSIWECTLLGVILQAAYMPGSVIAGYFLNSKNAKSILMRSATACGLLSAFCLRLESFWAIAVSLVVFGFAMAFFFNSFQTFMRSEASLGMTLKSSVAMYNFSWSLGAGAGSLTAGILYNLGVWVLIATALASTVAILALLFLHKGSKEERLSGEGSIEESPPGAPPVSAAYVFIGWTMIFTALFVQRPIFTFLPPLFAKGGTGSFMASLPLFAMMAVQSLVALAMLRWREHLYRRTSFWIVQSLGSIAFVAIWLWPRYAVCLWMLLALGVYSGYVFFCSVYYASNSKRSSFNIGVNEGLVGLGSIVGIFAGDFWMRASGSDTQIYLMCACGLAVSTAVQIAVATIWKERRV